MRPLWLKIKVPAPASLLQSRLKLGYNRTGRLMDQLEADGIVGPKERSKVRDVLIKTEADLAKQLRIL